eukprot:COSAG06_NODE_63652_length_261_cov_2.283951_1_plen_26_part_10
MPKEGQLHGEKCNPERRAQYVSNRER